MALASTSRRTGGGRAIQIVLCLCAFLATRQTDAHPMVENALDVVISADRVSLTVMVSPEEVRLTEPPVGGGEGSQLSDASVVAHGDYLLKHFHVLADGRVVKGRVLDSKPPGESRLVRYRLEYALRAPPELVRIDQDLLREFESWSASCVVRIRQSDQDEYQTTLLTRDRSIEYDCDFSGAPATRPVAAVAVRTPFWPTLRDYFRLGVAHILEGYDHLLFVAALVLAAAKLWDLVKVVTAFTLAHTLTLTLSVLNIVSLPGRVVEPMIAASIVFVALQNVFWAGGRTGWTRTAVAFAFGLFHGLGFAGDLKEAMAGMPHLALGAALTGFSAGVEAGHQVVVLPLFALLFAIRHHAPTRARHAIAGAILRYGSCAISLAGMFFLFRAMR
jgi:hydrogenase/urease accessory protein HupE